MNLWASQATFSWKCSLWTLQRGSKFPTHWTVRSNLRAIPQNTCTYGTPIYQAFISEELTTTSKTWLWHQHCTAIYCEKTMPACSVVNPKLSSVWWGDVGERAEALGQERDKLFQDHADHPNPSSSFAQTICRPCPVPILATSIIHSKPFDLLKSLCRVLEESGEEIPIASDFILLGLSGCRDEWGRGVLSLLNL